MKLCRSDRSVGFERGRSCERWQIGVPARSMQPLSFVEPPGNLRDWFSDETIRGWIEQELDNLDWQNPGVASYLNVHPHDELRPMLGLLTFALLASVFGSEETARECRAERRFQVFTESSAPFAHELWNVRRKYRAVLEQVLTGVLVHAICSRFGLGAHVLPWELHEDLRRHAGERLEIARQVDSCCSW